MSLVQGCNRGNLLPNRLLYSLHVCNIVYWDIIHYAYCYIHAIHSIKKPFTQCVMSLLHPVIHSEARVAVGEAAFAAESRKQTNNFKCQELGST